MPLPNQGTLTQYKEGDAVWVKKSTWMKHVEICGITCLQSVVIDSMPWHMEDVHSWLSSLLPVDNGSDTTSGSNEW